MLCGRACLKDIPDSLIFHLKRFDFNLRTLQRSKINDHFSFPSTVDMRPYTVDFMENPDIVSEDLFELVGVLVHSGTAESGHYYSYIRERPSTSSHKQSWVEFNDEIVSTWDQTTLESCCFGGPDFRPGGDASFDKSYSAYMLFYQRSSSLAREQNDHEISQARTPLRVQIPDNLAIYIAMENELTMRKYCLYEPSQTLFVSRMLGNMKKFNGGTCSRAHDREKHILLIALNHLDQVVSRTKDLPQFTGFLNAINRICQKCAECSRDYIEWYIDCSDALRMLLLRNPDAGVRAEISSSILTALKKVRADAAYAYGFDFDDRPQESPHMIFRFIKSLVQLYESFHMNTRAWPEYFGLLGDIANLGREEAAVLLKAGFLMNTLSIICADPLLPSDPQYQKMWNNISKRMATRPVSYEAVVALLARLLQSCDGSLEPIFNSEDMLGIGRVKFALLNQPIPLTQEERHLLVQQWVRGESNVLVEKLLRINQNQFATQSIVTWLLKSSSTLGEAVDESIHRAILCGIQRSSSAPVVAPFLNAALIFCEHEETVGAIHTTIQEVARAASMADNVEGKDFLQFFRNVIELDGNSSQTSREQIVYAIIENVGFWGPSLLTSFDASVRDVTEALINDLILERHDQLNFEDLEDDRAQTIIRGARKLGLACLDFIQETFLRQRAAAVRATLLTIRLIIVACEAYFDSDEPEDQDFHSRKDSMLRPTRPFAPANFEKVCCSHLRDVKLRTSTKKHLVRNFPVQTLEDLTKVS